MANLSAKIANSLTYSERELLQMGPNFENSSLINSEICMKFCNNENLNLCFVLELL